jgi:hypothetical protein
MSPGVMSDDALKKKPLTKKTTVAPKKQSNKEGKQSKINEDKPNKISKE